MNFLLVAPVGPPSFANSGSGNGSTYGRHQPTNFFNVRGAPGVVVQHSTTAEARAQPQPQLLASKALHAEQQALSLTHAEQQRPPNKHKRCFLLLLGPRSRVPSPTETLVRQARHAGLLPSLSVFALRPRQALAQYLPFGALVALLVPRRLPALLKPLNSSRSDRLRRSRLSVRALRLSVGAAFSARVRPTRMGCSAVWHCKGERSLAY